MGQLGTTTRMSDASGHCDHVATAIPGATPKRKDSSQIGQKSSRDAFRCRDKNATPTPVVTMLLWPELEKGSITQLHLGVLLQSEVRKPSRQPDP
ncbi:hypothetical protein Taro_017375 [Colocasia esculenta]|uniref:Uncharacterized protein n=1 Tax=Colocasia esculenta TaxID=4460 RepID=A0A843UT10_COLES|nr:hypothetical protein [Colocasia esculenta]